MGIWQNLFEYGGQLEYYLEVKGSVTNFTEKLTHNQVLPYPKLIYV